MSLQATTRTDVASGKVSDGFEGDGHYRVTDQFKGPDPRVLQMTRNVFGKFLA
jgi:hypothetical protein